MTKRSSWHSVMLRATQESLERIGLDYDKLTWDLIKEHSRQLPADELAYLLRAPHPCVAAVPLEERTELLQRPGGSTLELNKAALQTLGVIVHCPPDTPGGTWDERLALLDKYGYSRSARVWLAIEGEAEGVTPTKRLDQMTTMANVCELIQVRPELQPLLYDHPRTKIIMDYADLTVTHIVPDQFPGAPKDPPRRYGYQGGE